MKPGRPNIPACWKTAARLFYKPELAYSEMAAVGVGLKSLPEASVLHLANSSVVRYAQLYCRFAHRRGLLQPGNQRHQGSLSTAVGYAAASDKLNFVAIGDLSFFYDMNALWNANIGPNLRILLLNNGGGEIFHTLPGLDMSESSHKFITAVHKTWPKAGRRAGIPLPACGERRTVG